MTEGTRDGRKWRVTFAIGKPMPQRIDIELTKWRGEEHIELMLKSDLPVALDDKAAGDLIAALVDARAYGVRDAK